MIEGEPIIDLWFPTKPRGKGRPQFRTLPRKDAYFIEKIFDIDGEDKAVKHYAFKDVLPVAYGESTKEIEAKMARHAMRYVEKRKISTPSGPVAVRWCAFFPPLQSDIRARKRDKIQSRVAHIKTPDKDNIEKLLLDALNGIAFLDDSQVIYSEGAKVYSHREGMRIQVFNACPEKLKCWTDAQFHFEPEDFCLEG